MIWPFRKKTQPAPPLIDRRVWNDNWRIGDTAECVIDDWRVPKPWNPKIGQRFTVTGWGDGIGKSGTVRGYFLTFAEIPSNWECSAFRKVQPVADKAEGTAQLILDAPNPPEIEKRREPVKQEK